MNCRQINPEVEDGRTAVRIGILGCSDIALRKFLPALAKSCRARLAAVSSRTRAKAELFAGKSDCLRMTNEELLASPAVDLVYLSLPNHLHEEWAIRALESGKHVICEKPLATSLPAVERMLAAAEQHGRLLYENQMFFFHPQHAVVKELISCGRLGRIKALRCFFGFPLPAGDDFRLDPLQGGGAFHDLARYPLGAALLFLQGLPNGFRGQALWHGDLNMAVHGTAVTAAGESFSFSIAFGQQYEALYEIIGESGKIRLERAFTTPDDLTNRIMLSTGSSVTEITVPPADHFQLMIDSIAATVQSGRDYDRYHQRAALLARLADGMAQGCMENTYAKTD
jgi:predicted dehydrogenase